MNDILLMIILIINTIAVLGSFIVLIILLTKKNREKKNASPPIENTIKRIEYSDKLLEYIRSMINSITYIEFKEFIDNHELSKVSKSQLTELAKNIASKIKKSINNDNIDFNYVIFSINYFDQYIIHFSIDTLKQLWEKAIRNKLE